MEEVTHYKFPVFVADTKAVCDHSKVLSLLAFFLTWATKTEFKEALALESLGRPRKKRSRAGKLQILHLNATHNLTLHHMNGEDPSLQLRLKKLN